MSDNKAENICKAGDIALALAGRDEGRLFAVIAVDKQEKEDKDGNYVYIADGSSRRAEKPKRKKIKHLKMIKAAAFELKEGEKLTNAVLRKMIEAAVVECKNLQKN